MTARQLAFGLLQRIETNDQFLNIALDHALSHSDLSGADRALAATLVYGVTERRITLDFQIDRLASRPAAELDAPVRCALRLGLYQLLFLDRIPPHAAVSETVSLVPRKVSGFVNAVLRAASRAPSVFLPDRESDEATYLSVAYSVCLPLCQKLLLAFGAERTESVLKSFFRHGETTLAVNTLRTSREELAKHIPEATPTAYSPNGLTVRGSIRELYGFDDGLFYVQDEASQLCVEALGAMEGETLMDICACPGSKSFGSAIRMNNRGIVRSYDLHAKKLPLIESGAARLGISIITPSVRDGRDFLPELEGTADRVLCDVPCSGFGVLAKKPELRYKDPAISSALPDIQLAILSNACRYVQKGGTLVYSTCTVFPEENRGNIERFLSSHPDFSLTPFSFGGFTSEDGCLSLLGDTHGTDGFFIAKLTKN